MGTDLFQRSLYIFMRVAEEGSFSAAGRKLHMTQAAISQQVDKLEHELEFKLFDRTGYRPILSEAGKYFYQKCTKLDKLYQQIECKARSKSIIGIHLLRIGITGPFEEEHLPNIIRHYNVLYPQVKTDVKFCTFMEGVNRLEQNYLDLAFGITNDFRFKDNLQYFSLFAHSIRVICSKKHPFATKTKISGKDLAFQRIISFSNSTGNFFISDFKKSFVQDGIKPIIVRETDNLNELILAVKLNQGIALLAQVVIPDDPDLCSIPLVDSHHHAEFCVGINKNNKKSYLMQFIQVVSKYFSQLQFNYKNNL